MRRLPHCPLELLGVVLWLLLALAGCHDDSTGCCIVCAGQCACGNTCIDCSMKCTQGKGCACTSSPTMPAEIAPTPPSLTSEADAGR